MLRRLTGDGSAREIAADLYVSHNTVKTQMRSIYRKLGVATREDAVRARPRARPARAPAHRRGRLSPPPGRAGPAAEGPARRPGPRGRTAGR